MSSLMQGTSWALCLDSARLSAISFFCSLAMSTAALNTFASRPLREQVQLNSVITSLIIQRYFQPDMKMNTFPLYFCENLFSLLDRNNLFIWLECKAEINSWKHAWCVLDFSDCYMMWLWELTNRYILVPFVISHISRKLHYTFLAPLSPVKE